MTETAQNTYQITYIHFLIFRLIQNGRIDQCCLLCAQHQSATFFNFFSKETWKRRGRDLK
jgi:hypothetical protein